MTDREQTMQQRLARALAGALQHVTEGCDRSTDAGTRAQVLDAFLAAVPVAVPAPARRAVALFMVAEAEHGLDAEESLAALPRLTLLAAVVADACGFPLGDGIEAPPAPRIERRPPSTGLYL